MRFDLKHKAAVAITCVTGALMAFAGPASATPNAGVRVIADGLNGPSGISVGPNGVFVAESSKGQVTQINRRTGEKHVVASGLNSPDAVAFTHGKMIITTGAVEDPTADATGASSVYVVDSPDAKPRLLVDLMKYELANNVDGQLQFDPTTKQPLDSLSNPFSVIEGKGHAFIFVADAGANAVYAISRNGDVRPFFLPPLVTDGLCKGAQNNDPQHAGCDPVPTGLAYGPNGDLYVSTLGALTPGAGKVYELNPYSGHVKRVIDGLDAPSGVAVDECGNVYTSEVTYNAPPISEPGTEQVPPPADFDPATVGRIVKTDGNDHQTQASVTMPVGLAYYNGALYSSAWSVAGEFFQLPDKGQVVKVSQHAFGDFVPSPAPAAPAQPAPAM